MLALPFSGYAEKPLPEHPQRPNVIFIYADDIGYGDLSCNGAKTISTPHVEQLAAEGVRFTNAHSAAATSTPARYAMLRSRMEEALELAKELLGESEYSWQTTEPQA